MNWDLRFISLGNLIKKYFIKKCKPDVYIYKIKNYSNNIKDTN